jgi:hemolysin activation/secretion protein
MKIFLPIPHAVFGYISKLTIIAAISIGVSYMCPLAIIRRLAFALCIFTFINVAFNDAAFGQNVEQSPMDRILDRQKLELQKRKLFEAPKIQDRKFLEKKANRTGKYCVDVEKIKFEGSTKLTKRAKDNLSKKILDKCIFNDQIGNLINGTVNHYIGDGYSNARGYFRGYDDGAKTLIIFISEGIISELKLNDIDPKTGSKISNNISNSFLDKSQIFFAFPTKKGDIFNIDDVQQGLFQMNRLRSNNAKAESIAGEDPGTSNVTVNNQKSSNSLELSVNYDNSGSKSTGLYNTTYAINKDNLLYMNDNISLSQVKSDRSETNMFNISIPIGYYTFIYSDTSNNYNSYSGGFASSGTSSNHDLSINRLLFRGKINEFNLNSNLNLRNLDRKIAGVTDIRSQRLSTGRFGVSYTGRFKNNLTIFSTITYSKGIKLHSAIDDKKDFSSALSQDSPRSQFNKVSYNLNLYKRFRKYFNYSVQLNGQHSPDSLYSSELLYIGGGKYSVRGLQYAGISGSKGAYVRNDLSVNIGQMLNLKSDESNKTLKNTIVSGAISIINKTTPYIFYDHGFARKITRLDENAKTQYISGAGLGLKFYGKYINADVSYAASLNMPRLTLADNEYQSSSVYFGISGRYWLW